MRKDELFALEPTIVEELAGRPEDLKQFETIMGALLGANKMVAYDALGDLEDLLADIAGVSEHSSITEEEWDARRTDFCRAAELYLDARWQTLSEAKGH